MRRPKGTGTLTQRADGLWIGRADAGYTMAGNRRRLTVSSRSKAEAQRKLRDLLRTIHDEGSPAAINVRLTVKAWSDQWLPMHATRVRPTTYTTDAGTIRKWIVPTIGLRRLADLTPADTRALRRAITAAGRSTTTALHAHKILTKMLKDAVIEGHHVPQRVFLADKPAKASNDRDAVPVADLLRILDAASRRDDGARWVVGIFTGARQGEVLGLEWDRLTLPREGDGAADLSWQLQHLTDGHDTPDNWDARHLEGRAWLTRPKTKKGARRIPLVPGVVVALSTHRSAHPSGQLVFTNNGHPIQAHADRAAWQALQREAGVSHPSGRPWLIHETRHAAATLMRRAGVPDRVREAILGHVKLVETYDHADDQDTRDAMAAYAALLTPRAALPSAGDAAPGAG